MGTRDGDYEPVLVRFDGVAADGGAPLAVRYEASPGWHRVSLDDLPLAASAEPNDAMEKARLVLTNPADTERIVKLMFEKTAAGLAKPEAGVSAFPQRPKRTWNLH